MERAAAVITAMLAAVPVAPARGEVVVAGYVEPVIVAGRALEAKLDTGADTSSLGAEHVHPFWKGSERWVRFRPAAGETGGEITARVGRVTSIRRPGGVRERRLVVRLPVCLAGQSFDTEFTLADRAGFEYAALIGRQALAGRVVVDAARTRLWTASCPTSR